MSPIPFFTVIIVSLNPGSKLKQTVSSILTQSLLSQNAGDIEILVKDGNSTDGSVEALENQDLEKREVIRIIKQPDAGIYDAMNQAAAQAKGEILFFLNCGDLLHDRDVLKKVKTLVQGKQNKIFYGDIYSILTDSLVPSNPHMDAFGCYRNVPCHQACFYRNELFSERGYLLQYKVRADYEHFLWSFFKKEAKPLYMPIVVADYEGDGFSETKENKRLSAKEHKEITSRYMSMGQRIKFQVILWLTLAPLRSRIAESKYFSGIYNGLKKWLYKKRRA